MRQTWDDDRLDLLSQQMERGFELARERDELSERNNAERFARVDERFDRSEERFEAINDRFDRNEERFESINDRFDRIDERLAVVDQRFDGVDRRLDRLDDRFERLNHTIAALTVAVVMGFLAVIVAIFLGAG